MGKPTGFFRFSGTTGNIVTVDSKTCGEHTRSPRGTHKRARVNKVLAEFVDLNPTVNHLAKLIKDSFDPYRKDFYDGTFWSRLLSIIKKQLFTNHAIDWTSLVNLEFSDKNRLQRLLEPEIAASISSPGKRQLTISASARVLLNLDKEKADQYQQTLIALFLSKNDKRKVVSVSEIFNLRSDKKQVQTVKWSIPPNTAVVMVAMKCDFFLGGKSFGGKGRKGMALVVAGTPGQLLKSGLWVKQPLSSFIIHPNER